MKTLLPALCLLAAPVLGQQTPLVQNTLGPGFPLALSPDGSIAAFSNQGTYSLWTATGGTQVVTGGVISAYHMAKAGIAIPGRSASTLFGGIEVPSVYNMTTGTWTQLGVLPGAVPASFGGYGDARVATPDASVICGKSTNATAKGQAFRWTPFGGMQELAHNGGQSMVTVVSDDGSVMGGWDEDPIVGTPNAALWDAAGNITYPLISSSNPTGRGYVRAMSANGAYHAGDDLNGAYVVGKSGYISLGTMIGPNSSSCLSMSASGDLVTGVEWVQSGPFSSTPKYWFWTQSTGIVDAQTFLVAEGLVPTGTGLAGFAAMGDDGSTLLGSFETGPTDQVFHVKLPTYFEDLGLPLGGTLGNPVLVGHGSAYDGWPVSAELSNALPGSIAFLAISSTTTPLPLFGGTIQAFPPISILTLPTGGGSLDLSTPWPTGATGANMYLQYGIIDPGAPQGVALSNTLRIVGL